MVSFSKKDDNRQFISVKVLDNTSPSDLFRQLKVVFSGLSEVTTIIDVDELLIELDEKGLGFSLSEFRRIAKTFSNVDVSAFIVDLDDETQRNYWA